MLFRSLFVWCGQGFPEGDYSLRNIDNGRYKLLHRETGEQITEMDELQAYRETITLGWIPVSLHMRYRVIRRFSHRPVSVIYKFDIMLLLFSRPENYASAYESSPVSRLQDIFAKQENTPKSWNSFPKKFPLLYYTHA